MGEFAQPADRRLLTTLVLGTIAWQGRLDYELAQLSSRKLDDLDPEIHAILRLGLYQLRHLSRIPAHAAVDTSVRLARELKGNGASGFVNAVLRTAIRQPVPLPRRSNSSEPGCHVERSEQSERSRNISDSSASPDAAQRAPASGAGTGFPRPRGDPLPTAALPDTTLDFLSIAYSHPRWLVERFVDWFGLEAAEAIMAANNEAAPNAVRLNLARGTAEVILKRIEADGMEIASRGLFPETIILKGAPSFDSPSYREGLFSAQSEASQMVTHLLSPERGATVVDCAAAPGGKSAHLAEIVGPEGKIIALDINLAGLKQVRTVATRLGHRNIHFLRSDTSTSIPLPRHSFRYVLLDAPCMGLGTLREHPEIRWRLKPTDFARIAELQARMLENAATLVAPGGVIVYSVCSPTPEEGATVISEFLARHPQFTIDVNNALSTPLADVIDADGFIRTRPDHASRDGFFGSRLRRQP
jgi:16S rRNA (cytosine967-C5)-methyltransferase